MKFQKATKEKAKLRAALFGPSGAGKTFSALRIATGIGGTIGVIDTERGSASKYADRFDFLALDLPQKDIDTYCAAIKAAAEAGINVLIIDSLSHAWQELLTEVEKLAQAKYRGNTWSAWSEGTPKQRQLVDALLDFPGHVIATMRSKTEWTTSDAGGGKSKPVRVGLAPEQGKGIEYEFDLLLEITVEHVANVIKDRTGRYQDKLIEKPGESFGKELAEWLSEGADPLAVTSKARAAVAQALTERGFPKNEMGEVVGAWLKQVKAKDFDATTLEQRQQFIKDINAGKYDPAPPDTTPLTDADVDAAFAASEAA